MHNMFVYQLRCRIDKDEKIIFVIQISLFYYYSRFVICYVAKKSRMMKILVVEITIRKEERGFID